MAVLGSEPEIYFLSQRRSATGFIYAYPLMENAPYALGMQKSMIQEIEQNRPEYVIFVDEITSWCYYTKWQPFLFDWWKAYAAANMEKVLVIPVSVDPIPEVPRQDILRRLMIYRRKPPGA